MTEPHQLTVEPGQADPEPIVLPPEILPNNEPTFLSPSDDAVAMPLLKVIIRNPISNLCVEVSALLDSGSKRTYILDSVVQKLDLVRSSPRIINTVTFKARRHRQIESSHVNFELRFSNGSFFEFSGNTTDIISEPFTVDAIPMTEADRRITNDLVLASPIPEKRQVAQIDSLLGSDYEPCFHCDTPLQQLSSGVYLKQTRLGWITQGVHSSNELSQFLKDSVSVDLLSISHPDFGPLS